MHDPGSIRSINVRLPEKLFEVLRQLAKRRGQSMNKVVEESIRRVADEDRKQSLRNEFARIAKLPAEENDVEFATEAQREVVLGDE